MHSWNRKVRSLHKTRRGKYAQALGKPEHVDEPIFGAYTDPTVWLGRKFTEYESLLMVGPNPVCRSFSYVTIGDGFYRTAGSDRNKSTLHSYFRTFFINEQLDKDGRVILNKQGVPKTKEVDRCVLPNRNSMLSVHKIYHLMYHVRPIYIHETCCWLGVIAIIIINLYSYFRAFFGNECVGKGGKVILKQERWDEDTGYVSA